MYYEDDITIIAITERCRTNNDELSINYSQI